MPGNYASEAMSSVKFGIMGGSFDPVHFGHLMVANEVAHVCGMEGIIFVPAGNPPHKDSKLMADFCHRYEMVRLSMRGNDKFSLSDIEIVHPGKSYTVDTLRAFKRTLGECELFFITGIDAILQLPTWKEPENLMKLCTFIAVDRPGYSSPEVPAKLSELGCAYGGTIEMVHVPMLQISSTDIRQRVRNSRPIKYLVPDLVEQYIFDNKLYEE